MKRQKKESENNKTNMIQEKQIEVVGDFAKYLDAVIGLAEKFGADGTADKYEYKGWEVRIALKKKKEKGKARLFTPKRAVF